MAATPKKPDAGSSSGGSRRPRTQRTSSSLSAASSSASVETPSLNLTAEAVAALPPPGLSGPTNLVFSPGSSSSSGAQYLAFVSSLPGAAATTGAPSPSTATTTTTATTSRAVTATATASIITSSTSTSSGERQLCVMNVNDDRRVIQPLLHRMKRNESTSSNSSNSTQHPVDTANGTTDAADSLEERLRRERQRLQTNGGVTQFSWCHVNNATVESNHFSRSSSSSSHNNSVLRILVPIRGNIYIQDGINGDLYCVYDKQTLVGKKQKQHKNGTWLSSSTTTSAAATATASIVGRDTGAIDPQLSPDGTMVAFVVAGDVYVVTIDDNSSEYDAFATNEQQYTQCSPQQQQQQTRRRRRRSRRSPPIQVTYGARQEDGEGGVAITHGLADFVAQEEMDRYRGFWWQDDSSGILFAKVDETRVPPYRITHQGKDGSPPTEESYEDHRYPFAGQENPRVQLGYVKVAGVHKRMSSSEGAFQPRDDDAQLDALAQDEWSNVVWFAPPREASEYLARVSWLPDGTACAQWQNRTQTTLVLSRMDPATGKSRALLTERSDVWINLNHMFHVLPRPVHPDECGDCEWKHGHQSLPSPLPEGSFSFLFASERSLYSHLYLYTFVPGIHGALLLRALTFGEWVVESIAGVDMNNDVVYVTGTYDSPLERHMYAVPITNRKAALEVTNNDDDGGGAEDTVMDDMDRSNHSSSNASNGIGVRRGLKSVMSALSGATKPKHRSSGSSSMSMASDCGDDTSLPVRLTIETGMHNVIMDEDCRVFVDSSSDLGRPSSVKVYRITDGGPFSPQVDSNSAVQLMFSLYDAAQDNKAITSLLGAFDMMTSASDQFLSLPPPEIISFPTSDGMETLHAALYVPDARIHGPGPYPLVCAVYGGPHVQRVNRSWSQCADMRAQRLRSLGFAVAKCDNRGSSRRGLRFESAIRHRLGRLEVLDQVTTVRQLTMRGIADPSRVGIYGWSYGGYLSAMCLCRAPDIFHVAIAGAPVTSWDGYDTHYTERYMGLPSENATGYRESAVFEHVPNMRGKLMIVHGLIDENVHFRHTARLINRLIACGKDYDLLIFPDERHSPRRLRDRIYMEQRISDYFMRHLGPSVSATTAAADPQLSSSSSLSLSLQATRSGSSNSNLGGNNNYVTNNATSTSRTVDSSSGIRSMAGRL